MAPQGELFAQAFRLAEDLLRGALIVPETGVADTPVELG